MKIDIHTLVFALGIINIIQAIMLFLQYMVNKSLKGMGWLAMGSTFLAIGFAFNYLRDAPSIGQFAIIANNMFFLGGSAFFYIGIMNFLNKHCYYRRIIIFYCIIIGLIIYFTLFNYNLEIRIVIMSFALSAMSFLQARSFLLYKIPSITTSAYLLASVFISYSIFFIIRLLITITFPLSKDIFNPSIIEITTYVVSLMLGTFWTFGFIIMVNQKLNAENHEAKENLELIFNTSPDAVIITRFNDGCFVAVNDRFTSITGFTRNEAIGKSTMEINIWCNLEARKKFMEELEEKGFCENIKAFFMRKDGRQIIGMVSAKIFEMNEIPHIISVTRDITELVKTEEALRESERQYMRIVDTASEGICAIDGKMVINFVNPTFAGMLGYEVSEIIGRKFIDFYFPEDIENYTREINEKIEKKLGTYGKYERRFKKKDGTPMWALVSATAILDNNGEFDGSFAMVTNITERKLAEEALQKSKEKFKAIANYAASWEAWFNTDGKLIWMNSYCINLTGYTPEEYIAAEDYLAMIVAEEDLQMIKKRFHKALQGSSGDNLETRVLRKDGSKFWVSISWCPILDSKNNSMGFRTSAQDITRRKLIEAEQEKLITDLQNAIEQIKTLRGIVPICASCKKIRDDKGYWEQVEAYISRHTEAQFSHGICPDCIKKLYPELYGKLVEQKKYS